MEQRPMVFTNDQLDDNRRNLDYMNQPRRWADVVMENNIDDNIINIIDDIIIVYNRIDNMYDDIDDDRPTEPWEEDTDEEW